MGMRGMILALVLVGGCSATGLPLTGGSPDGDVSPVDAVPVDDWAHFATFSIQRHSQASGLTWAQAQASCEALDASLPTEWQWLAAATRGPSGLVPTHGVEAPVIEWWFYQFDTVSYLEGTSFYFEAPKSAVPAFRCARGDQYPRS
jgi:formylglycine-generating enzyme required for sulfatase activity